MRSSEPATRDPHLTVFGCEPDEGAEFRRLAPELGISLTVTGAPVSEWTVAAATGSRCVSVSHKSPLPEPLLAALREAGVEHITTRSVGVDHIDLRAAERLGIAVENVAYPPDGVADHTLMLILMVLRHAKAVVSSAERADFRLDRRRGRDLRDLTVGVVGVGRIGRAVVDRLRGFGCRVLACDDRRPATAEELPDIEFAPLEQLVRESDVVTLHAPLTPATHHLIGAPELAAMKPGAVLVNTARGALVDTGALLAALERGRLGGAGLDVVEGEQGTFYTDRRDADGAHPFLRRLQRLPNVVVTPHSAYYSERTLHETVRITLEHCIRFERNRHDAETQDRDPVRGLLGGA